MIGTTEKTAISEMRSPYPNAPFAERYFSTVINWKRWQDTRNPLERVALACHEIMVLAGVEKTDNYQVCNRILRSDRIVSSRHYQLACHSSNREGNQLYSLRLRWVDQGTWLVSFESRHSPEGKMWKDGHRRGSRGWFRYIAETDEAPPDPAFEAPWEGRAWQRLEPVARYDMHMTTDCHFGRRDPRQLDCGKAMKNSLELMATEEAFTSSFRLENFPGLEDWLRKHTDIALEVDNGVLKLRHYLMYSPADFGGEIADLSHYQECQTMLNGFSDL
jgi:hypothetical protein